MARQGETLGERVGQMNRHPAHCIGQISNYGEVGGKGACLDLFILAREWRGLCLGRPFANRHRRQTEDGFFKANYNIVIGDVTWC